MIRNLSETKPKNLLWVALACLFGAVSGGAGPPNSVPLTVPAEPDSSLSLSLSKTSQAATKPPVNHNEGFLGSPYQATDSVKRAVPSRLESGKRKSALNRTRKKGSQQITADGDLVAVTDRGSDSGKIETQRTQYHVNDPVGPRLAASRTGDKQDKAWKKSHSSRRQASFVKQRLQRSSQVRDRSGSRSPGKVQNEMQAKQLQQMPVDAQFAILSAPKTNHRASVALDASEVDHAALKASSVIRKTRSWLQVTDQHLQAPAPAPAAPAPAAPPASEASSVLDILTSIFAFVGVLFCMGVMMRVVLEEPSREQRRPSGRSSVCPPRLKALNESRRGLDRDDLMDLPTLRYNLQTAGLDATFTDSSRGLTDLHNEVHARNCEVLWVNDPEGGRRLIRLVRLFRGLVTSYRSNGGDSVLTEATRTFKNKSTGHVETETINKPITLKMRLDVADGLEAGKALLAQRLHIPRAWQIKYLKVEDDRGYSYVEEDISIHYRGLTTWYLINEWHFGINLEDIPEEDQDILGLPDDQTFTTSEIHADEEIIYSWKWQPRHARAQSYWSKNNKGKSSPLTVDDFATARTAGEISQEKTEQRPTRGRYSVKAASRRDEGGSARRSVSAQQRMRSSSRTRL